MPVMTNRRDSDDDALVALNELRLSRNWSYPQLAADMARVGHHVAAKTLHALLTTEGQKPYDRTLYQIRRYLEVLQAEAEASKAAAR